MAGGEPRGYRWQDWQVWKVEGTQESLLKTLSGIPFATNGAYYEIEHYYLSGYLCVIINEGVLDCRIIAPAFAAALNVLD